jgi:hypothetical protein
VAASAHTATSDVKKGAGEGLIEFLQSGSLELRIEYRWLRGFEHDFGAWWVLRDVPRFEFRCPVNGRLAFEEAWTLLDGLSGWKASFKTREKAELGIDVFANLFERPLENQKMLFHWQGSGKGREEHGFLQISHLFTEIQNDYVNNSQRLEIQHYEKLTLVLPIIPIDNIQNLLVSA